MNTLGWSSEAGNPNIQDLKETWQKAEKEAPRGHCLECAEIQPAGAVENIVQ